MRLGIIGSGQLARMLILAATPLGIDSVVFTSSAVSPSTQGLAKHIIGTPDDSHAIEKFLQQVDCITYENENIPIEFIQQLEQQKPVYPNATSLQHTQHRLYEKNLFKELGIPVYPYCSVNTQQDLLQARDQLELPFVVKACRNGYDGKQQWLIKNADSLDAFKQLLSINTLQDSEANFIAEGFVEFDYEASIIGVRDRHNHYTFYDLCINTHQNSILFHTKPTANHPLWQTAKEHLTRLMSHLGYVGTGTLELFVKDNKLFANEFAPRVHNSGHWTIEGAHTSQFENHIRAANQLPLGSSESPVYAALFNCIGALPPLEACLAIPRLHYHDYKKSPRPQRKLGHITLTAAEPNVLETTTTQLKKLMEFLGTATH